MHTSGETRIDVGTEGSVFYQQGLLTRRLEAGEA